MSHSDVLADEDFEIIDHADVEGHGSSKRKTQSSIRIPTTKQKQAAWLPQLQMATKSPAPTTASSGNKALDKEMFNVSYSKRHNLGKIQRFVVSRKPHIACRVAERETLAAPRYVGCTSQLQREDPPSSGHEQK
jgi:hypothetical protein